MFDFPNIDPVAVEFGPLVIRWYALAYLSGFLLGWRYCLRLADFDPALKPDREQIDDFLTWAIIGVILGGRLGYVMFYQPGHYLANPGDILKLWHGGMSFHGGALGVILALILFAWKRKVPFLRLSDIVCACVPIGLFFGRLANFINGELFGRVTDSQWGMVFPHGGPLPRHPSQLYEAVLEGAVLFVILLLLIRNDWVRARSGIVAGAFLAGYGVFRAFVEFFREPDAHLGYLSFLGGGFITMGQVLSLPMVIVGGAIITFAIVRHKSDAQPA